jgi:hypothetical protein
MFQRLIFLFILFATFGSQAASAENLLYPADAGVIDVTKPPYNAKGDGKTDDTNALQRVLNDYTGKRNLIFLPNGVYLISRSLVLPLRNPQGNMSYGFTNIQGQSRKGAVLRLSDNAFTDPSKPVAVLDSGRHGSADWFHNSVQNLTIDIGRGNSGAIGLRFFSNNTGCVRDVTIRSRDGWGVVGLDLAYNDMNGPLLIQNLTVQGFQVGVLCGNSVNSQTFSHLRLENQRECGLRNQGQCLAIENLVAVGSRIAVDNRSGQMALIGAKLTGINKSESPSAIVNTGDLYARRVQASRYGQAIQDGTGEKQNLTLSPIKEWVSSPAVTLFSTVPTALNLPVQQTPEVPWDDPKTWASPFQFGAKREEGADISDGLQRAIDSGATTVYIPTGAWRITKTIVVRNNVRRILGMAAYLIPDEPVNSQDAPYFRIEDGTAKVVVLERISSGFGGKKIYGIQNNTARTVVLRDSEFYAYRNQAGAGALFVENVVAGTFTFTGQTVWARQLNQESEGTHITNAGGTLWILGLKTERGGTLVATQDGGRSEILGGLCYTTTAGKLAPMFTNVEASVSVTLGERCYTGDPYTVIVSETRQGQTRTLPNTSPDYKGRLVLYVGTPPQKSRWERSPNAVRHVRRQ